MIWIKFETFDCQNIHTLPRIAVVRETSVYSIQSIFKQTSTSLQKVVAIMSLTPFVGFR